MAQNMLGIALLGIAVFISIRYSHQTPPQTEEETNDALRKYRAGQALSFEDLAKLRARRTEGLG